MTKNEKNEYVFRNISETCFQEADGCEESLTVKTADLGAGEFFVLETEKWSFDSVQELVDLLERFREKYNVGG